MKNTLVSMVFGMALFVAQSAEAVYVTVDSSSRHYRDRPIFLGGRNVVGITGDYFELGDGTHTLHIDAPRNHYVSMDVEVRRNNLEIEISKGQSLDESGCRDEWRTAWRGRLQTRRTRFRQGALWTIVLPEIRFIRATGEVSCMFPSSLGCRRIPYSLDVDTWPRNAEVWVGGESLGYRTPTGRLANSYCDYEDSVHITTRARGYVNCARKYDLFPGASIEFRCEMKRK